jgi:hypothetical protein
VWVGVGRASELAGTYFEARPAAAATVEIRVPRPLPRARLEVRTTAPRAPVTSVFGAPDTELLAPLGAAKVVGAKLNHGGTSLSLRIEFANGARAAFKPEQIHTQSDPRREIAAYRLDRLLGIGRVPPAKPIAIPVADLLDGTPPKHRTFVAGRIDDEAIARHGVLYGEASWWVPEIKLAALGSRRIDEDDGVQLWRDYLSTGAVIPEEHRAMAAQIAELVLFDALIDNPDRWSGANTVMSPDGRELYFMDNSMSFSRYAFGHERNVLTLRRMEVFPRGLVDKLRGLTLEAVRAALAPDADSGLGPLLSEEEMRAILTRRDNMLVHIDRVVAEHGEAAVFVFP